MPMTLYLEPTMFNTLVLISFMIYKLFMFPDIYNIETFSKNSILEAEADKNNCIALKHNAIQIIKVYQNQ